MKINSTPMIRSLCARCRQVVDEWITTTGVRYFSPLTNMAIPAEETGKWPASWPADSATSHSSPAKTPMPLADELADVLGC